MGKKKSRSHLEARGTCLNVCTFQIYFLMTQNRPQVHPEVPWTSSDIRGGGACVGLGVIDLVYFYLCKLLGTQW